MAKIFENEWAFEAFLDDLSFEQRHMFGAKAAYLNGKIVMLLAQDSKKSSWNGVLLPLERDQHVAVLKDFPMLVPHSILPKWLFLQSGVEDFEQLLTKLSELIARGDMRFGVIPKPKKTKTTKKKTTKKQSANNQSAKKTLKTKLNAKSKHK